MPPLRGKKRKSNESAVSYDEAIEMTGEKIPTKSGDDGTQQSPLKKRKIGLTLAQKQALIEDLQLESQLSLTPENRIATLTSNLQSRSGRGGCDQTTTSTRKLFALESRCALPVSHGDCAIWPWAS